MITDSIDRKLGALLEAHDPEPDPAFVERVVLAARLDQQLRGARQRAVSRAMLECAGAVAVGAAFFALSRFETPMSHGMIALDGPTMGGLVMLLLWGFVALPGLGQERVGRFGHSRG